eukprot:5158563-Alexandrium_andersonii.AAC.1
MSASLVGSEMCIRDSTMRASASSGSSASGWWTGRTCTRTRTACSTSVSYTHLTLPTICSV